TQILVNNGKIDGPVLSGQGGVVILQVRSWAPPRPPKSADYPTNNSVHGTLALGGHSVIDVSSKNGNGGKLSIATNDEGQVLLIDAGSLIKANSATMGNAGTIQITAPGDVSIDGNLQALVSDHNGEGGHITLTTTHALVTNKVHFDTSSSAGQFGTLTISAPDLVLNGVPGDEQIVLFKPVASNIIEVGNLDNWLQLNNVVLNSIAPKSETFAQLASGGKIMLHSDNNLTLNAGIGGIRIGGSLENVGSGKLLLTVDRDIGDANYLSKNKYDASKFGNILIENRVSVQDLTAIVAKGNGQIFVSKNGVITARDQASFSTITGDITFDAAVTTHELALTTKGGAISINDDITLDGNGALAVTVEGAGNISFAKNKTVLGGRVVTLYTQTGIITLGKDLIVSDGVQLAIKDILANGVTQANLKQLAGSDPKLRAELDLIARAANSSNADQNAAFDLLAKIEPEVAVRLKFFKLASGSGTAEQKANAVTVLGVYDPEFATDYAAAQTLATQKLRDEQSDLVIHNAMQRLVVRANADRYLAAIERDKSLTAVTSAAVKLALGAESTPLLLASDADYQTKFATIYGKGIDAHDTLALSKSDILSYDTKTQDDAFKKLAQLDEAAANRLKIAIRNAQALPTGTVQLNAAQQLAYQIAVDSYLQGSAEKAHENVFAQAKIDVTKASRSELHFTAKKIITSSGDIAVNDTPHNGANGRLTTRELPSNYTYFDLDAGGGSFTYNQTGNEGAAITINHKYAASTDPSVVKANLSDAQVITITNNGPLILVGVDTLIGTLKASSSSDLTLNSPITANGSVDLSAGGNVTIGASIKAKGDVSLSTPRDLQINSSLEAGGNFTLSANHLNFGNDPGAKGSIKAGTGNTITLHQLATDRDLIVDQNFLATINYDPSISLNLLSRRDLKITAALNGTNGTNIHLFSVGTLSTTSPITTGALEIEGKYVSIGNNITVGAGGISVLAGGEAKPRNDLGLVISGPTGKPGGDYYVKATDGGDINLKTLKGVQIWVQSTLSARNITVSTTEGTLVFEKPVLADAFDGAGGSFSAKLNGNGGLLFKDTVTVNSLSIENKANGSIDFYRDLTLNSYAPKGSTDATSGGTVSITTENGSITFSKAAHIVSNDPSHLAYKINFVTKRGIVMNTDLGVRAGGVMNLEAWLINYTKITADNANLVIKQNGYKSRIWNKKLVKVAPYDITLDDRISFKNANTIYFQTLGTIYVKHDLSAPNVVLLANHVDIPDGVTIRATVGGILAFAQFGSYTVDNTLLAKFKDYQNANLKLISGGTLTVANDIKMNEGYNLSLAMFDVNLKANVSVSRATMSVSYINGDIYSIAKFEQSNADHILLGKGSKFEIVGASNLTVNGVVKNQYIADYKLSNSGVMTINANLLASQHLGFSAAKGLIYINNAVGISSPYGEPVVITTQDNGKFLKFGTGGKILPLPAEDVAEGQK
ncbi:MAG: hypothetical protein ORN98_02355, partial [Alphaproteobacteria bacterium]|nr:hypothetical protein [Alphaproteobacteria bacterium]